jgi:hypothetical protein
VIQDGTATAVIVAYTRRLVAIGHHHLGRLHAMQRLSAIRLTANLYGAIQFSISAMVSHSAPEEPDYAPVAPASVAWL